MGAPEGVEALFIDYGQLGRDPEERAVTALAAKYNTPLSKVYVRGRSMGDGEIPGRNMLMAQLALIELAGAPGRVLMGIHAGTGYRDCSPEFAELVQRSYDFHSDGRVQFAAPFAERAKAEIIAFARDLDVPLKLTYSCERGTEPPCGECVSCRDRQGLLVAA
jgi:7-cyano-7-deazaguanine synthase